jgi:predicted ABC-type ATPase
LTGAELFDTFLDELSAGAGNRSLMLMIAGPNGAGKTTLWRERFERMLEDAVGAIYINADDIERELNETAQLDPRAPQTRETAVQAQSEATRRRELLLTAPAGHQSHFVYETVFSDPYGYKLAELQRGIAAGFFVVMVFVGLDDVEVAQQRVLHRASEGGHSVDPNVQTERFGRVFANARSAIDIVPLAMFFDNTRDQALSGKTHRPVAIFKGGELIAQHDTMPVWWPLIVP